MSDYLKDLINEVNECKNFNFYNFKCSNYSPCKNCIYKLGQIEGYKKGVKDTEDKYKIVFNKIMDEVIYIETLLCDCEYAEDEETGQHKYGCLYIQFRDKIKELSGDKT